MASKRLPAKNSLREPRPHSGSPLSSRIFLHKSSINRHPLAVTDATLVICLTNWCWDRAIHPKKYAVRGHAANVAITFLRSLISVKEHLNPANYILLVDWVMGQMPVRPRHGNLPRQE